MPYWLYDILYPLSRWLHIVCTTLIVGGTLFFELVLPIAIEDLKREQQLYVFARARLVFRWVVWIGVIGLLISGAMSLYRMWKPYQLEEFGYVSRWAFAHVALGAIGMILGLLLTIGREPPANPVRWMRLNLVVLLVAIFLGSATRHFQLRLTEQPSGGRRMNADGWLGFDRPSTQPATQPATNPTTRPAPSVLYMVDEPSHSGGGGEIEVGPGVFISSSAMRFQFARSGGPGGQNVNKLNTKAELWVRPEDLRGMHPEAVGRLANLAGKRLTKEGEIHIVAETARTQEQNRAAVMEKLRELVVAAMHRPKIRRKTRPSRAAKERRLESKKRRGEIKAKRRGAFD